MIPLNGSVKFRKRQIPIFRTGEFAQYLAEKNTKEPIKRFFSEKEKRETGSLTIQSEVIIKSWLLTRIFDLEHCLNRQLLEINSIYYRKIKSLPKFFISTWL